MYAQDSNAKSWTAPRSFEGATYCGWSLPRIATSLCLSHGITDAMPQLEGVSLDSFASCGLVAVVIYSDDSTHDAVFRILSDLSELVQIGEI